MSDRILARLTRLGAASTAQLHHAHGTGYTLNGFRKILERMEAAGLITRTEPGRCGRTVWWTLP